MWISGNIIQSLSKRPETFFFFLVRKWHLNTVRSISTPFLVDYKPQLVRLHAKRTFSWVSLLELPQTLLTHFANKLNDFVIMCLGNDKRRQKHNSIKASMRVHGCSNATTPTMQRSTRQDNSNSGVVVWKANNNRATVKEVIKNRWKNMHAKEGMLEIGKRQYSKIKTDTIHWEGTDSN